MVYVLILAAAASRLAPHPANFAPIGALGLFAGATLDRRGAWAVPLAALLLSDAALGFYNPALMAFVYAGFAMGGLLGRRFLRADRGWGRLGVCSVASATAFFALSNFGCWVVGMYPHTWEGLARCYVMALPFFRNTLLGDLVYMFGLFGAYALVQQRAAKRQALHAA